MGGSARGSEVTANICFLIQGTHISPVFPIWVIGLVTKLSQTLVKLQHHQDSTQACSRVN